MIEYLTSNYYFNINQQTKILVGTVVIILNILIYGYLQYQLRTNKKDDKEYIEYIKDVNCDYLKYFFIGLAVVVYDLTDSGKINIIISLGKIGLIYLGLITFQTVKNKILPTYSL